jgi:hypothetical protein
LDGDDYFEPEMLEKLYNLAEKHQAEIAVCSSRKVDDDIYMITNKYVYYRNFNEDEILPLYKDTCIESGEILEVPIENIRCFPSFEESSECSYMIITGFSLDRIGDKANVETFIGTGNEIYCSKENLYVTKTEYNYEESRLNKVLSNKNTTKTKIKSRQENIFQSPLEKKFLKCYIMAR